jgi:hypothetical protein
MTITKPIRSIWNQSINCGVESCYNVLRLRLRNGSPGSPTCVTRHSHNSFMQRDTVYNKNIAERDVVIDCIMLETFLAISANLLTIN